ncbi:hybrid sensor histidine kinase/response regulator [Desulfuromonas sp. KJ2020]|uniref:hybrid sensor histidine kinase/response regulator n=1 Tax=Desulfuromonas sp. KJ2020 TaxID=2919173 RepID=UPI0020A77F48|nr:hybrid sensor histidine kinase/response regulator [Desulfuromonas sp. KJ2020]MCP3176463.1 hybrid sensor histidine kinase/response regulator [Desulfuromonas sp. KJ2020]
MTTMLAESTGVRTAAVSEETRPSKGRILVVEDERELAEILEYNLDRRGFDIVTAYDGLSACRLVGSHQPDLVLLDILLPDLDGWEICRLIRGHQNAFVAQTPILMMTALGTQNDKLKGLQLGADDYVAKPYSVREICAKAESMIARRRRHLQVSEELQKARRRELLQADIQYLLLHEMRNQLVIIGGFSQILEQRAEGESLGRYARTIDRSARYLRDLSNDFLFMRQVEDQGLQLPQEICRLEELFAEMVILFAESAQARGITFSGNWPQAEALCLAHAPALRVVLSSLLDNAIKYSDPDTVVTLNLRESDDAVYIEIDDQGRGIADEEMERIFDRFFRGDGTADKVPGSGLGLYMARVLVEAMGGSIRARRGKSGGTCMEIQLLAPVGDRP